MHNVNEPDSLCSPAAAVAATERATGVTGWQACELRSSRTAQSYLMRAADQEDRLLRFALEPALLEREIAALDQLPPGAIGLQLERHQPGTDGAGPAHALFGGSGRLAALGNKRIDVGTVARLCARLHDLPSLRPMRSFAVQEKPSILAVFQRVVENQRAYLLYREQDGLPQDMLALTLADLGRVVRRFVVAQEHHFLPHPRRTLCHGALDPTRLLRAGRELRLFGFEEARVGDAARDLALFAVAAKLDETTEDDLLDAYLDARAKSDDRFVHRYFAHKLLCVLERPVTRLLGLYRIKYQGAPVVGDVVEVLNQEMMTAIRELAAALTTLNDFLGRGRPLAPRDVASMGRLVAYEDYLLRGRNLVIGIEGAAYTQKTPVATELAARLEATYVNVGAWLRTGIQLAGAEPRAVGVEQVLAALAGHEVVLETVSEPPHYHVLVDGADVTDQLRTPELYQAQHRLLGEARVRAALAAPLRGLIRGACVVEAETLDQLLPDDARRFTLFAAPAVREKRQHEHAETLGRELPTLAPAPPPEGVDAIDTSHAPTPQLALDIIQRCLPADLRAEILVPDFTGRRPLFER